MKIGWTGECSVALDKVKDRSLTDFDKGFIVRTDASDEGLSAILLQGKDDEYLPVAYASQKLLRLRNMVFDDGERVLSDHVGTKEI